MVYLKEYGELLILIVLLVVQLARWSKQQEESPREIERLRRALPYYARKAEVDLQIANLDNKIRNVERMQADDRTRTEAIEAKWDRLAELGRGRLKS